jgi:glyoxylase-like metal-dependent hydrolase (beta-lactamase superfamily II)
MGIVSRLLPVHLAVFAAAVSLAPSALPSGDTPAEAPAPPAFCAGYPRPEFAVFERLPLDAGGWFDVYRIDEGVTAIHEPHQWQEVISYLIEGETSALLFDTGNGIGDIAAVVAQLTDKPVTVLNSHGHYDHVGGNHAFESILGMNTRFTIARQKGLPNAAVAAEVSAAALCRAAPVGIDEANHVGRPYRITRFIEDGHRIDLGGRVLEVVLVPGHTPDAIALLDRDAGLLWTGDSFYAGPIWLFAPETDLRAYRRSLERLIAVSADVQWLLPAHNTPRVSARVMPRVLAAYDRMIAQKANRVPQGEGMIEYRFGDETPFSFMMRDEPLPYAR